MMVTRDKHCRFGDGTVTLSPRIPLSCPAKAGHPVRRGPSTPAAPPRSTGSPACAGDDTSRGAKRRAGTSLSTSEQ
ncbi:hypothetical protein DCM78_05935 [Bradyrhizobium sp. WBOS04]|nr:hypothetical protein DCM78_05935 [Bradyrhizobium sp. WBOS04]